MAMRSRLNRRTLTLTPVELHMYRRRVATITRLISICIALVALAGWSFKHRDLPKYTAWFFANAPQYSLGPTSAGHQCLAGP